MARYTSKTISGWTGAGTRSFTLKVEETTYNHATNKSSIKWTLTIENESNIQYSSYVKCTVNGVVVYNKTVGDFGVFPAVTGSKSGTLEVEHTSNGSKTISFAIEGYACDSSDTRSASGSLTLQNLDRTEPNIVLTCTGYTTDSISISATADTNCNLWLYKIGGGTWTQFSTTNGTTVSKTFTGLSPGTEYTISIKARKTSNEIYGLSDTITRWTDGTSKIQSAQPVTLGSACNIKWTPLDSSFKYKIRFQIEDAYQETGYITPNSTNQYTYTNATPAIATFAPKQTKGNLMGMYITLLSYTSGGTLVGDDRVVVSCTIPDNNTTKPTVGTVTLEEGTSSGFGVYCSTLSKLKATITGSEGKYGATIVGIQMTVENKTFTANSSGIAISDILTKTGTVAVTITVTDSRGFKKTSSQNITVYEYYKPSGSISYTENGTSFDVAVTWKVAPVFVSNETKNTVSVVVTRKKVSTGTTTSKTVKTVAAGQSAVTQYNSSGSWNNQGLADGTTETYEYTLKITDKKGNSYAATYIVTTGITAISILGGGKGVAFFGEAQEEGFWTVDSNKRIRNDITAAEYLILARLLASTYSTTADYEEGDFVIYSSNVYECNTACTAGSWSTNSSKFTLLGSAS